MLLYRLFKHMIARIAEKRAGKDSRRRVAAE